MGFSTCFQRAHWLMLFLAHAILIHTGTAQRAQPQRKTFNVMQYGAVADERTDNAKAFLKAWEEACKWEGRTRVLVPEGKYMLGQVSFQGPCKAPITFVLKGDLKAYPDLLHEEQWINFRYIDKLIVNGGGTIDGQGALSWSRNFSSVTSNCIALPVSIGFDFVTNSRIYNIRSVDSKSTHISIFGCTYVNITKLRIFAPDESPNTDGIRIGSSSHINISQVAIGTGDDCVSLLSGIEDIHISNVMCGPGHGISVGSLGRYKNEYNVTRLLVENSTFIGTDNGIRIKTWASSTSSVIVSDLRFEDVEMRNVSNPIIIDQEYCPQPPCREEIKDVTFKNIWGTSRTQTAVLLKCSKDEPCININMEDIDLSYNGTEGTGNSSSLCYFANYGLIFGRQNPSLCVAA